MQLPIPTTRRPPTTGGRIMSNSDTFFLVGLPFLIGTVWSKGVESPILMVGRGLDELEDRTTAVIEDEVDEIVDVIDVVEVVVEVERVTPIEQAHNIVP